MMVLIPAMLTCFGGIIGALINNWTIPGAPAIPISTPVPTPTYDLSGIFDICFDDFFDPTFTDIYELITGIAQTFSLKNPATETFAMMFFNETALIGGMKLRYIPTQNEFALIDNINHQCLSTIADGKEHFLKNNSESEFFYTDKKYSFFLQYDPVSNELIAKLTSE